MKKMTQLFTSSEYSALQDPTTEDVIIEFVHSRYMDVVRFVLRADEKGDQIYVHEPWKTGALI